METANQNKVRILHVLGSLGLGGAESRIVDLYRHIDRDMVQFDFLVHADAAPTGKKRPSSDELMAVRGAEYYDDTVRALGAGIYAVPRFLGTNLSDYRAAVRSFFAAHRGTWRAVQGHMTSTAALYLPLAKQYGHVPVTIAHARSAGVDPGIKGIVTRILRLPLQKKDTVDLRFAVSREAAASVFGRRLTDGGDVRILKNAIDVQRYAYDADARRRIRDELHIPEKAYVIGHAGRFHPAKNHAYLLRCFAALLGLPEIADMTLRLLLIGDGPLMNEAQALAKELNISANVIFAGRRSDIAACYQAMDLFFFPSLYEGLPGTVLEAQAAGLKSLISDAITKEVDVTPLVKRCSVREAPAVRAEELLQMVQDQMTCAAAASVDTAKNASGGIASFSSDRAAASAAAISALQDAGFDIVQQAREMQTFYLTQGGVV